MEMLLKKEIGTAKVILIEVCFLGYRFSGNGHPWQKPRRFEVKLRQQDRKPQDFT
jgi:hypothetical protein